MKLGFLATASMAIWNLAIPAAMAAISSPSERLIPHGGWSYPRYSAETPIEAVIAPTTAAPASDPMAPRPDALVFRVRPATETSDQPAATEGGARYYSIHRQAGRTPDTPRLPEPVYLDALPVELNNLPDTQDLAEPPPPPALARDAQGRLRPLPDLDTDPSLD